MAESIFQLGTWMRTEAPKAHLRDRRGRLRTGFLKTMTRAVPAELWAEFKMWCVRFWGPAWRAQNRGDASLAKALTLPAQGPEDEDAYQPKYRAAGLNRYGEPVLVAVR